MMRLPDPFRAAFLVALVAPAAACSTAPSSPPGSAPSGTASAGGPTAAAPTPGAPEAPSPSPTALPRPAGTLAWPAVFGVELEEATYFSSPPFVVPFTLTIAERGWVTGHINGEFFDLLRFDGIAHTELPNRILGFGVPEHVRGPDGDVPVAGLTPEAALDLLVARSSLAAANRHDVELFGLAGARIDLHTTVGNNPLFGGPAGDFGLAPERDVRLAVLPHDGGFLLVLVQAEADDLEAAWAQGLRILETVELQP